MVIFKYNCESSTLILDESTTEYSRSLGITVKVWQYEMCNDGGGESSGHITSVHQPICLIFLDFHHPSNPLNNVAHLQLDQVNLKAAIYRYLQHVLSTAPHTNEADTHICSVPNNMKIFN